MISHEIQLRIRYGETDQMGFCYYGNYAQFLEVARVETLRKFGISYKELEEEGILLPVRNFSIKYIAPAKYDDIIHIQTVVNEIKNAQIIYIFNFFKQKAYCDGSNRIGFCLRKKLQANEYAKTI